MIVTVSAADARPVASVTTNEKMRSPPVTVFAVVNVGAAAVALESV